MLKGKLVAKICKATLNPNMHKDIYGHMQALLYETPSVHGIGELERPPCKTPIPPSCVMKRIIMG